MFRRQSWGARMAAEHVERKLAAILAANVVGYSRLVGDDEAGQCGRCAAIARQPRRWLRGMAAGSLKRWAMGFYQIYTKEPAYQKLKTRIAPSVQAMALAIPALTQGCNADTSVTFEAR
jgi:hypothetical protein